MVELEERIARLEGRVDEHSKFFESINVKLTLLEDKEDRNRERLEEKIDRTREILEEKIELYRKEFKEEIGSVRKEIGDTRKEITTIFRWLVGIQITTWITVLLAILFK